ncbi:hypothetical protein CB1_000803001 [Camelus ferus]|nr:hypothetical protein CB1_000803001 [Camelus ferus]
MRPRPRGNDTSVNVTGNLPGQGLGAVQVRRLAFKRPETVKMLSKELKVWEPRVQNPGPGLVYCLVLRPARLHVKEVKIRWQQSRVGRVSFAGLLSCVPGAAVERASAHRCWYNAWHGMKDWVAETPGWRSIRDASLEGNHVIERDMEELSCVELRIGNLEDYYHFYHSKTFKRSTLGSRGPHTFLRMDPQVKWLQQQEVKRRVKRQVRSDPQALYFNDPIWSNMWYMHCGDKNSRCRSEMNVQAAWKRGYTGKNVVVTILDDGIERNHPDLAPNYDSYASYDVNGNDYDPSPRYDASNENKHGTRCAGEVAASANNSYCIVGVAYNAKIGGLAD